VLDGETVLKLDTQINSALMQLHGTPWLKETWGNRDIYFGLKGGFAVTTFRWGLVSVLIF
jgi:hypothetical protein